jgi:hypothetical protein
VLVPVYAHDFWIGPDDFQPEPEQPVNISLYEGVDFRGESLPFIPDWFSDFSVVDSTGRNPVDSIIGDDPAAILAVKSGATLLGYRSNRSFVELGAAKFNSYLENEGIEFIREQRRANGEDDEPAPEYFVRCAKALLQTDIADDASTEVYGATLGYILELVALNDPYARAVENNIEFQLFYRGQPAEGLLVQAFTQENPAEKQKVRTDADGKAVINVDAAGTWMVKAVNIQPIMGDPKAKWQSYWASYVFTVAGEARE